METNTVMMPRELTAENGAKAILSGEFYEEVEYSCPECSPDDADPNCDVCHGKFNCIQRIQVSWTTIKAIYKKAVETLGN